MVKIRHKAGNESLDDPIQKLSFAHSRGSRSPVDVVRLSALRRRPLGHSIADPTRLEFHLLQFVTSGSGRHWNDFEPVKLKRGDIHHVRPGQVHAFDAHSAHDALLLVFEPNCLAGARLDESADWLFSNVLYPSPPDFDLLTKLVRLLLAFESGGRKVATELTRVHVLAAILSAVAAIRSARRGQADPTTARYEQLVRRFDGLLNEHHASSRNLDWYCGKLYTTGRTMARACRRVRGMSPKQVIDRRVTIEAKRQLAVTSDSVEAIGDALGFTEATNFIKFFRRVAGVTPETFRREKVESK